MSPPRATCLARPPLSTSSSSFNSIFIRVKVFVLLSAIPTFLFFFTNAPCFGNAASDNCWLSHFVGFCHCCCFAVVATQADKDAANVLDGFFSVSARPPAGPPPPVADTNPQQPGHGLHRRPTRSSVQLGISQIAFSSRARKHGPN